MWSRSSPPLSASQVLCKTTVLRTPELLVLPKRLDSSASFQFHIWNYLVCFSNYIHKIFDHLVTFIRLLSKDFCQKFDTPIIEGHMSSRTILQASLDAAGTAVCAFTSSLFLRQFSWLLCFQGEQNISKEEIL